MEGLVFSYKKFAVHDGDGIRTTIFLSGCPLSCVWCHNPEGLKFKPILAYYSHKCVNCGECVAVCPKTAHNIIDALHYYDRSKCVDCGLCEEVCLGKAIKLFGKKMTDNEVVDLILQDKEFYGDNGGATLSGGECLMQAEFCLSIAKKLQNHAIKLDIDTSGYVDYSILKKFIPYTDCFLYDFKAFSEQTHIKYTGVSNNLIKENLVKLCNDGANVEIRIPYVPNYNSLEMEDIAKFICKLKIKGVRILPYHNLFGSKNVAIGLNVNIPEIVPTTEEIESVIKLFESYNINVLK